VESLSLCETYVLVSSGWRLLHLDDHLCNQSNHDSKVLKESTVGFIDLLKNF